MMSKSSPPPEDCAAEPAPPDAAGRHSIDLVMGPGDAQRVGRFRFFLAGQRWEWSDVVARIHGYEPGTLIPDTELLLSHKHPEDGQRVADALARVLEGEHRIIDTAGHIHWVIVVGERMFNAAGTLSGTAGFYVDITDTLQADITSGVSRVAALRAEIEQAKES